MFSPLPWHLGFGGAVVFSFATWWLIAQGATTAPMFLDQFYYGYGLTPLGSLVGLVWGFICGVICGGILAWLYNFLAERIGAEARTSAAYG
jgi:ABC-type thiamin/hydroxymethylpyrimidine transport system permease subunit